jgi:hypothetical protein
MGWALRAAAMVGATALTRLPAKGKRWLLQAIVLGHVLGAVATSFLYLRRLV